MSYAKIHNLYRPEGQAILRDPECYALEKVHGTSSHWMWKDGRLTFSSGGADPVAFRALFDAETLAQRCGVLFGDETATVYGEAYGGTQQGQAWRYGPSLRFVVFEVMRKGGWRDVPTAAAIVESLGLEFVPWVRTPTDLAALDALRDAPSEIARRRGMGEQPREGVILRPLAERSIGNERVIAKHKRKEERETATFREVDPGAWQVLTDARAIAAEWVTAERMRHVAAKFAVTLGRPLTVRDTRAAIDAMQADITAEASGEFADSPEARKAIATAAQQAFAAWLREGR